MAQRLLPDGTVVDASSGRQTLLPDGSVADEAPANFSYDVSIAESASAADSVATTIALGAGVVEAANAADSASSSRSVDVVLVEQVEAGDRVASVRIGVPGAANSVQSIRALTPHLFLTDAFPVTLSTELGGFAEEVVVADRYGDLRRSRFKLIRMTSTLFVAARHPMEITRVFTGDLETTAFEARTEALGGHSCTVVEFASPVPLDTQATASGLGKRNETTGEIIENPADILTDTMALADRDDLWWAQLRAECSAAGIRLAGSFASKGSIRDRLDTIVDSSGGIWCPGMARLYPAPIDGFRIPVDRTSAFDLAPSCSAVDTADILRVAFGYDEAEGKNKSFIVLEASPQRYGGTIADVELPMVHSAAIAEAIGRRLLTRLASVRVDVTFVTPLTEFTRPGTWAVLTDHPLWPFDSDANLMFGTAVLNRKEGEARITAESIVSDPPVITLTQHSIGSDDIGEGGVEVTERNGVATFTIRDSNDKPLAGAFVSLDGAAPKKTNEQGQVSFVVTEAGEHQLDIAAQGYLPQSLTVTLQG